MTHAWAVKTTKISRISWRSTYTERAACPGSFELVSSILFFCVDFSGECFMVERLGISFDIISQCCETKEKKKKTYQRDTLASRQCSITVKKQS